MFRNTVVRTSAVGVLITAFHCVPAASFAQSDDAEAGKKRRVLPTGIVVSQETTRIDGPITEEGYIDYAAALDARYRKGVTVENNAAIPFWRACGPPEMDKSDRVDYFKRLGIPVPPEEGNYFADFPVYVYSDERYQALMKAIREPWSKQDYPAIAEWIVTNEKPLKLLVEASRRNRFYSPLITDPIEVLENPDPIDPGLIGAYSPSFTHHRHAVFALLARAMFRLEAGDREQTAADLIAAHRLTRLFGQRPRVVDKLASTHLESKVLTAERAFVVHGKPSATELSKLRSRLKKLPSPPDLADAFDVADRYTYLDTAQRVPHYGVDLIRLINDLTYLNPTPPNSDRTWFVSLNEPSEESFHFFANYPLRLTNWNTVMRDGNKRYDRLVKALRTPNEAQRQKLLKQIDEDDRRSARLVFSARPFLRIALQLDCLLVLATDLGVGRPVPLQFPGLLPGPFTRGVVSRTISRVCRSLFRVPIRSLLHDDQSGIAQTNLTSLTFALAAYRAERGKFPDALGMLKPKFIHKLPKDPYSGEDFRYRRIDNEYALYSVGRNGKDDNGKSSEEYDGQDDIVVRLTVGNSERP